MDPLDRAARLEALSFNYRATALFFNGRRAAWRNRRADYLIALAWDLIK